MTRELLDKVIDVIPRLKDAAFKLLNIDGVNRYNFPLGISSDGYVLRFDIDSKMFLLDSNDLANHLEVGALQMNSNEIIEFAIQHIYFIMNKVGVLSINGKKITFDALDVNINDLSQNVLYGDSIQLNTIYELPLDYLLCSMSKMDYLYSRASKKKAKEIGERELAILEADYYSKDKKALVDCSHRNHILTTNDICKRYDSGESLRFVFFGECHSEFTDSVGKECFSRWYSLAFEIEGKSFFCIEQYMMAEKACFFDDEECERRIMNNNDIEDITLLGQQIKIFDGFLWDNYKKDVIRQGNVAKFADNKELFEFLISTDDAILVEATPYDVVWGIGMREGDQGIDNPHNWKGENILGFTLMKIRDFFNQMN